MRAQAIEIDTVFALDADFDAVGAKVLPARP